MEDRKVVLVIQGNGQNTQYDLWLQTPCDTHGTDTVKNEMIDVLAANIVSPHEWLDAVLLRAYEHLCLCGGHPAPESVVTSMLEASHG